ncbi:MAG: hypothetical protein E7618_01155 [Ruminococcaceae bacterium]|nr:hypothetical protein [Oscillospiraceae bacterium]
MSIVLGIDTSNYTSSCAVSQAGKILCNVREMLRVAEGERGLRQSDAVFQHTVNLPKVFSTIGTQAFDAVGVSDRPRDVEGSYMPCFLSGVAVASALSATAGVPLYRFSHQAGHLAAALYAVGREDLHQAEYLAFHVSGGTTELMHVKEGTVTLLGGTKDISCGKAIDRIGVRLGLPFPCGKHLEAIADDPDGIKPGKLSVTGLSCNLSGLENRAAALCDAGAEPSAVAGFVLSHIGAVLEALTNHALALYPGLPVLYAGGVMSNRYLKQRLGNRFDGLFADPQFSCDNAAGIARLTELTYRGVLPLTERSRPTNG